MDEETSCIVTGAFSFTGRYVTERLLLKGFALKTLTSHPKRTNPFEGRVEVIPYCFENPDNMIESFKGVRLFFNTYWIRFPYGNLTFEKAIYNSKLLIDSAKSAGVERFIHISITNPSLDSDLPYFKGKAIVEDYLKKSGLSYAIIRPTVIFGRKGILINNIAWLLKRMPVFAIPGDGKYSLQPIYVEDLAGIMVEASQIKDDITIDAGGEETYTFEDLVRMIKDIIKSKLLIIHLSPLLSFILSKPFDYILGDVLLTRDEVKGLLDNLLVSKEKPKGKTLLSKWLSDNCNNIGRKYLSELKMHYK